MVKPKFVLHYLCLVGFIALGAILRLWNLDLKPLWMDEIITALFSLGKNYNDVPLEVVLPLENLRQIFSFQPGVSCAQIATNIATQSTHPPLFFCGMYTLLEWMHPLGEEWVTKLRLPSALFGVGEILAIYFVNRIAFSPFAGLIAAALMAVSPYAVYLSQEARHYTLPVFLITLALLGLVQIQKDIEKRQKIRVWVWLAWTIINSIGFYVHYFSILAFIAQMCSLVLLIYCRRESFPSKRKIWGAVILSSTGVVITFFPWLPVMLAHSSRSETDWLNSPQHIVPLFQTVIGWVLMVITLPIENQPLPIIIISVLFMLLFAGWLGRRVFQGIRQLWATPSTHLATLMLLNFSACVLLEFFGIIYLLGKDISTVPRYNFVYYPGFCALLAASLSQTEKSLQKRKNNFSIIFSPFHATSLNSGFQRTRVAPHLPTVLLVGILSSIFVVSNLVFQKPFTPRQVAQTMSQDPSVPLMLVMGYRDYQDVALGLSFALALEPLKPHTPYPSEVAFFQQSSDFSSVWQKLKFAKIPTPVVTKLNLWVVAPGRKRRDYPLEVSLSGQMICLIDSKHHYRIGVPYQLYRCQKF
ncbi:MAG: glycosyltransferase family 39 protein [Scytonema sp. PMC 1069.18]|nr:glycosyltransferase family 39 protein [Scytonema sp. PMC 1069.18]MEC4886163.1 glycosyltransferase family 39 protein [Scytonema sp. PMC 1070.18]